MEDREGNLPTLKFQMSEEDIRKRYPWDAADLKQKLKNRYIDFKENPKYHALKKKFVPNPQYMNTPAILILAIQKFP